MRVTADPHTGSHDSRVTRPTAWLPLLVALVVVLASVFVAAPVDGQAPQVSVVDLTVTPESPSTGQPITLTATVQNSQRSEFGFEITRVEVRELVGSDERVLAGQSEVGTLGPGDQTQLSQTIRFEDPGVKRLTFIVYGASTGRGGGSTIKYPVTVVVDETRPAIDTNYSDLLVQTENDFTVTVNNGKSTSVRDVRVRLSGEEFSVKEPAKSAAVVGAGESVDFGFVLSSETSGSRLLRIDLSYTVGGVSYSETDSQTLFFRELGDKVATVSNFTQVPERVRPGAGFDLSMTVQNQGETALQDLAFSLDLNGTAIRAGSTGTDVYVSTLSGGSTRQITYRLRTSENAPSGIVSVPLSYRYTTEDGRAVTDETALGIEVLGTPELQTFVRGVEALEAGYSVTVDVANVGDGIARSARIRLANSSYFLGDIEAGEFETATLTVDHAGEVPAVLSYNNGFNEPLRTEQSVVVPDQSSGQSIPLWSLGAVGVLALVAGVWWWRRWQQ